MKHIFTLLLTCGLLLGALSAKTLAAEIPQASATHQPATAASSPAGDFTYTLLDNGFCEITKYTGSDLVVGIPTEIDGHTVQAIGAEAFYGSNITEVVIPDTVTYVGDFAFVDCTALTTVTLPIDITCTLCARPFTGCDQLDTIHYTYGRTGRPVEPDDADFQRLEPAWDADNLETIIFQDGITEISDYMFSGYTTLKNVTLPNTLTTLGYSAFYNCTSLKEIHFPASLTRIEAFAFMGCTSLTELVIPDTLTYVGYWAFEGCSNVTKITLPVDLTCDAWTEPFSGVSKLREIHYTYGRTGRRETPENSDLDLVTLGQDLDELETVTFAEGITQISEYMFAFCSNLKQVSLPKGMDTIDSYAFMGCTALEAIVLPEGLTSINCMLFDRCTNLREISIPSSVTFIGYNAFWNCTALESITLPAGVTAIRDEAFRDCTNLREIFIPESVTEIGDAAFDNAPQVVFHCTEGSYAARFAQDHEIPMVTIPVQWTAAFKGASLSLNGIINVNFYAQINESIAEDVTVVFDIKGNLQELSMADASMNKGMYVFPCRVAAKEMASEILAQLYVNGMPVGTPITYSVQQYCENKLAKADTKETLRNLLVAMLNYGTEAQKYFEYHTDDLANDILTADQKVMAPVSSSTLDAFQMSIAGSDPGIEKSGASLLLEAETVIRYRIQLKEGYDISQYTFRYGNEVLTPVTFLNTYYVDITGIAAKDLDEMYPITVGGLSISYGPMSYVQRQLDKANTRDVVTALYYYNQMANAYFA